MTLHEKIHRVMFIGVEFHPQKYKIGQDEINQALDDGYEILWDYKSDCGVVFCLKKSVKKALSLTGLESTFKLSDRPLHTNLPLILLKCKNPADLIFPKNTLKSECIVLFTL